MILDGYAFFRVEAAAKHNTPSLDAAEPLGRTKVRRHRRSG